MTRNKIDLAHMGATGHKTPYEDIVALDEAGIPWGYKIVDSDIDERILQLARSSDTPNYIIFRRTTGLYGTHIYDVAKYDLPPLQASKDHFSLHYNELPPLVRQYHDVVIIETINEPDKDDDDVVEWLAEFSIHQFEAWQDVGFAYACFGWAGGCPEPHQWLGQNMIDLLTLAANHKGELYIATHEYSLSSNIWNGAFPESGEYWYVGRFLWIHAACDKYGISYPDILITEWGYGKDKFLLPEFDQRMADYDSVGEFYAKYPNVKQANVWCYNGADEWGDVGNTLYHNDRLALLNLRLTKEYECCDDGGNPVDKPTEQKIFEIGQSYAFPVNMNAALQKTMIDDGYFPTGEEQWHDVDGEKYALQPAAGQADTNDKRVYYSIVGEWNEVHWTDGDEPIGGTILNVPHMSQRGDGANERSNDCGAACVAMVVNGQTDHSPTVDDIAIEYQNPPHKYMNFTQLDQALNGYDMNGVHKRPYYPHQIDATITSGKPVIALVWYQSLPRQFSTFNGSHFIVVYGIREDGLFLYRDPLMPNGRDETLYITADELETAMYDARNSGNQPLQGMDCELKDDPVDPPGQAVDALSYFVPSGQYGHKIVMQTGGSTQPLQLEKRANDVILRKGDGIWIDGVKYQDSEQWRVVDGEVQKGIDTSDSGNNNKDGYDLDWAKWIPRIVHVGSTYHSTPMVRRFDRTNNCKTISTNQANDYLYIKELVTTWVSPANSSIVINDVLVIEWRSGTPDLNTPPNETYYFAKEMGYCGWGSHFINEITQGQQPLSGALDCGM